MNSKLVDSIAVNNETSGHQLEMILFIGPNLKKIKIQFQFFDIKGLTNLSNARYCTPYICYYPKYILQTYERA